MILIGIGSAPLWFDELAGLSVAERPVGGIFDVLQTTDANMGFYYLLLHFWLWFGDSEASIRSLSAIPALAAVPVTALLGRRLFGDAVGLIAGFLLTGSMFVIANAQNARAYALALLLVALAALFFVEAVLTRRRACFAAWGLASSLAIYASPLSALSLVALLASVPFLPHPRALLRPVALTCGATLLAVTPLAVLMLSAGGAQVDFLTRPGPAKAVETAREMLAMDSVPLAVAWAALVLIAVIWLWRAPQCATARGSTIGGAGRWSSDGHCFRRCCCSPTPSSTPCSPTVTCSPQRLRLPSSRRSVWQRSPGDRRPPDWRQRPRCSA